MRPYIIFAASWLMTPWLSANEAAMDLPACPEGQERAIIEVIEAPAVVTDVYGKINVLTSNIAAERYSPAAVKWVDRPDDYIRPETIISVLILTTPPQYKPQYEPYEFRKASYDLVYSLDGRVERRKIAAIRAHKVTYELDPSAVTQSRQEAERPYDPDIMEKDGKIAVVVTPATGGLVNRSWISQQDAVVSQERTPAKIRQTLGACENKN